MFAKSIFALSKSFFSISSRGRLASTRALSLGSFKTTLKLFSAASALAAVYATTAPLGDIAQCAYVPPEGLPGTIQERSFIAIKPDGVQRALVGEVISRFEKKGYKLVAMKLVWPSKEMAAEHYADLAKKPFFQGLVNYFSSGPIVAMVWEGKDVIKTGRKMLGATNPSDSEPGSIRGDFCVSVGRNLIHGSDGPDSASHEINFWFTPAEIPCWNRTTDEWIVADN